MSTLGQAGRLAVGVALLAVAVTLRPGAAAAAGPITFDDLKTTPKGGGGQTLVTDQYGRMGIVFDPVLAFDYSAEPGFTRSGTVAIEQCYGQEFCSSPIAATFPSPVSRVQLWVGHDGALSVDVQLALRATDADGNEVAASQATLPAGNTSTPISIPLEVSDPNGRIAKVELAPTDPTNFMNDVAVDDVEFDFPAVVLPPDLTISGLDPSIDGDTLTINTLVANVGKGPSQPTSVLVTAPGWSDTETDVPALEPGASTTVATTIPIPSGVRGGPSAFTIGVDPRATSGDNSPDNNTTTVSVDVPAVTLSTPPSEAPPATPVPTAAGPVATATPTPVPDQAGGDGGPLGTGVLLGGASIAVVGGALVGRAAWNRWSTTLTVGRKTSLELKYEDEEPTGDCTPGDWRCHREAGFDPHRRHIDNLSAVFGRNGTVDRMRWKPETTDSLTAIVRAARDQPLDSRPRSALRDAATVLAADIVDWLAGRDAGSLEIAAHVAGPDASAKFTAYRCGRTGDTGAFQKIGEPWTKSVSDGFDQVVASTARFDADANQTAELATALENGLVALGNRIGRLR